MICSSLKRFFTSNLLLVRDWTPKQPAAQLRGGASVRTARAGKTVSEQLSSVGATGKGTCVSEEVEVRVRRLGATVATIKRPLREFEGRPAITFKGQLWLLIDGAIEVGNPDPREFVGADVEASDPQPLALPPIPALPPEKENSGAGEATWQDDPIGKPADARLIVDAGPGTGKTHAACARVAAMVNDGIPPTRICLVSFTRTAVIEIRNRIARALLDPADAASVRIITLDAFAWAVQSGYSREANLTGSFDHNINQALQLIRDDPDVRDDLARIEHLIVDEAQDIVGPRAALVLALIDALAPESGVSVFADKAQAIYDFSESQEASAGTKFLDQLTTKGFTPLQLTKVHRTSDPKLIEIFTTLRRDLLAGTKKGIEGYVRSEIQRLAHEDVGDLEDLDLQQVSEDSLVLVRNRLEVMTVSSRAGMVPHRLRMSGLPTCIRQWVAQMFWDYTQRRISRDVFEKRWEDRSVHAPYDCVEAWHRCVEVAGESAVVVDLHRLRSILARGNPPMLFCTPEFGTAGPILGTIHASKGREAPTVYLYLQERTTDDNSSEESRVMFVGATRPRERLLVGSTGPHRGQHTNNRVWRRGKSGLHIEVGRIGDLDPMGLVGRPFFSKQETAEAAQRAWVDQPLRQRLVLRAEATLGWEFAIKQGDERLGGMGEQFRWNIREIGNSLNRHIAWLGHVRSMGLRTMAVAPDSQQLESMLEPWRSSGFLFAPLLSTLAFVPIKK